MVVLVDVLLLDPRMMGRGMPVLSQGSSSASYVAFPANEPACGALRR